MVLASFRQLEDEQIKRNVEFATAVLDLDFRNLAESTDDYAYWDRMCEFIVTPAKADIRTEFEDKEMEQLGFKLVVIRDVRGKIVFARAYDRQKHQRAEVPAEFLRGIFSRQQLEPAAVAVMPQDGIVEFADGPYIVPTRPILTSQRGGDSRGVFMLARKFDEAEIDRLAELTRTTITLEQIDSPSLPRGFSPGAQELGWERGLCDPGTLRKDGRGLRDAGGQLPQAATADEGGDTAPDL